MKHDIRLIYFVYVYAYGIALDGVGFQTPRYLLCFDIFPIESYDL